MIGRGRRRRSVERLPIVEAGLDVAGSRQIPPDPLDDVMIAQDESRTNQETGPAAPGNVDLAHLPLKIRQTFLEDGRVHGLRVVPDDVLEGFAGLVV